MDETLAVGVGKRLGDLPHDVQACGDAQALTVAGQIVVQPDGVGVVVEHQGRTQFVLAVVVRAQNAGVLDLFEKLELTLGSPRDHLARLGRCRLGDRVDAHAADHAEGNVGGLPVLVARAFKEQLLQLVVAHLARALRLTDAGFIQSPRDRSRDLAVDARAPGVVVLGRRQVSERAHHVRDARLSCERFVAHAYSVARPRIELAAQLVGGQEDQGFEERTVKGAERPLAAEQRGQLLGLAVGEQQRVVLGERAALVRPRPGACVALQVARSALDLDQEEALG